MGGYVSQDPIGLRGRNPNIYAYVSDSNIWLDSFGLTCEGKAIVKQWENNYPEGHFTIEIHYNGKSLETHQVGAGQLRRGFPTQTYIVTTKQVSPGLVPTSSPIKSVEIEIPNAKEAMAKQIEQMKAGDFGQYTPTGNSCMTHVVDILDSGGVDGLSKGRKGLEAFAKRYGFGKL